MRVAPVFASKQDLTPPPPECRLNAAVASPHRVGEPVGGLFREEVLQAQRSSALGAINLATPLAFVWWALLAAALAAAIVLFMVFGHYTQREQVSGQLVPTAGILGVHSPITGTTVKVYVHQGETVQRGQPLVEVSGEHDSAAMGPTQAVIGTQLHAQAQRLQAQLADQQKSAQEQASGLRTKLQMLQQQAAQIGAEIPLEGTQVASAQSMLAKMGALRAKGYVSALQFEQEQATALQMEQQVKVLTGQQLGTQQQIADTRQQLAQLPLTLAARQSATRQSLSQNDQQLAENELQQDAVLRAPSSGVVATLLVKPGEAVAAGAPLLSILPKGSVLRAQLLVPSSAVGFIRTGNQVVMRYQAYPYQKFGQQYGKVLNVSRSALSHAEAASILGQNVAVPIYRVMVALDRQTIDAYGKAQALKPGMAVDASILLDRRTLWQWAFEPLYGLRQELAGARRGHARQFARQPAVGVPPQAARDPADGSRRVRPRIARDDRAVPRP